AADRENIVRLRVGSWNMGQGFRPRGSPKATWAYLDALGLDFALVQEAVAPKDRPEVVRKRIYPKKRWGSGIVNYTDFELSPIPAVPLGDRRSQSELQESHPGAVTVADVRLPGDILLTLISIYGVLDLPLRNGMRYSVTSVHRMLSDLTPILDLARSRVRRVIMGGDLNITPQIPPPDSERHQLVIDRIKAFGFVDCLGESHNDFVRTHRHLDKKESPPYQDDWIFMSPNLKLSSCEALNEDEAAWALSDHCPVVAEFEVV
ncbi:MAG: hypothetical protein ACRD1T_18715, partial [Acidimicrobiia bacterium]